MSRVERILWSCGVCLACFLGAQFLIVKAPAPVLAQAPAGEEPTAPDAPPNVEQNVQHERIENAKQALRQAKSDEQRQAAKASLRQALADAFAEDMQARQKQAQEIENRLQTLRQQYEARWKVKDEIIDLQMKVLEQDAAGLGFPRPGIATGASRQPRANTSLEDFKKANTVAVRDLLKWGHFIESADGKLYAYVNSNHPQGPSLRVVDVATGKLVAQGHFAQLLGPIEFTPKGVASRETDGKLGLRLPLAKRNSPDGPVYEPSVEVTPGMFSPTRESRPAATSYKDVFAEYNLLRDQYAKAKTQLRNAEFEFDFLVAAARKQKPETTIDEFNKQSPVVWRSVLDAKSTLERAQQLWETRLELLDLDRKAARIALESARRNLDRTTKLHYSNAATKAEADTQRAELEVAELDVERADRIYKLFKSIIDAPPVASGGAAAPGLLIPQTPTGPAVTARQMLSFQPQQPGIEYDVPKEGEAEACEVVLEDGSKWSLYSRAGVLLRRFEDTNRDHKVDTWRYYTRGIEVYRDVDTDHDGKADRHESPDAKR